jgi:cytoskeletal protein RodZ
MDFGSYLRQAREQRGISLRQIATATKISVVALEALERNDISRLPGGIFSRAFVRSYAVEVGLDPDQTVQRFVESFPTETVTAGTPHAAEAQDGETFESQRRLAGSLLRLIVASVPVAGILIYLGTQVGPSSQEPPEAAAEAPGPAAAPPAAAPPGAAPPVLADRAAIEPPRAAVGETAGSTGEPPAAAATAGLEIAIEPTGRCWVQLSVDGERIFSRVMEPGEREVRRAGEEIVLDVGDASAFAFTINGQPGRPLGGPGDVVQARITAENVDTYVRR